ARHRAELRAGADLQPRADRAPIFIIGAPRSGTTLCYQLLVEGLDVGWLANAHAAHASDAAAIERAAPARSERLGSDYDSVHGDTHGEWGPSEAGEYWYRLLPRDRHQQGAADATPQLRRDIAAMVRAFADACAAPVVFKNTLNSLRVPLLAAALPEARFVLVERELAENARSLLVGRVRRGDLDGWWSARPDAADALIAGGASSAEQVVWQAREVTRIARRDLAEHAAGRWITIRYDELCHDPRGVLACTHEWLVGQGVEVSARPVDRIPDRFDRRGGGSLPDDLDAQLDAALAAAESAPVGEDGG
ncbi:MAG: sulfotransferase, partial [Thermoleophilia bacterium]|nr:sulfotransferase [Thermoleophilia bacterium]